MKVEHQAPNPKIEIFLPQNTSSTDPNFTLEPDGKMAYANLQSYTFSESVDDLEGSFSFSAVNAARDDNLVRTDDGGNLFDAIPIRSVVKIYEGGDYPVFVGIIRKRQLSKSMTSQGVKQSITFSGKSIISCIVEYTVSLDMRIQGVSDAVSKNIGLIDNINSESPVTLKNYLIKSWEYFKQISRDVAREANGITTIDLEKIIERHIGSNPYVFINVSGTEQSFRYGIYGVLINTGNNTVTDIWRDKLPDPVYELYAYCDRLDGKPKIMARQVPFGDPDNGNDDWNNLKKIQIDPVRLMSYSLEQGDDQVFTVFASYIAGSAREPSFYMALNHDGTKDSTVKYSDKMSIYGFRPLQITFNGYNKEGNAEGQENNSLAEAMQKLNATAEYWFSRLDEMYSGNITLCTDFNEPRNNPQIGCRAGFLGGEFYIEKAEHSWTFGGTPTIKLAISRGMVYDNSGKMKEALQNVGGKYRELEINQSLASLPGFDNLRKIKEMTL